VEPGVTGLLVPIGDAGALAAAVARLADDPELRERFGRAGRARAVERFDLGVVVEKTRRLYRGLLARGAKQSLALGSAA
jgi:glycosyltransferase involved in cell wall biosynthesis